MARICIVTPGQLGSNPRVVKEADALQAAGHVVTVISTRVMAEVEARDRAILDAAPWCSIRVAFDSKAGRTLDRLLQEGARMLTKIMPSPAIAAYAHSQMTRRLEQAAERVPADLYIAHYVAALPAAAKAARRNGAPYAFDAEDFHFGDLPDKPEHAGARNLIERIERHFLPGAAYVTAAAPGIARAYAAHYGIARPQVVLNTFPPADAPPSPPSKAEPSPSLYWFSQVIGPDRGLECTVEAMALARTRPSLYLRGMISDAYRSKLEGLADKLGIADRLHLLPPDIPSQMVALAARHDAGLVSETGHSHNRRIALTNKQFTYLLAGIPVLMSDIEAHRDFAEQAPGAAFLYRNDDPASLAEAIDSLLGDASRLEAARTSARTLARDTFNWDREKARLLEVIDRSFASRGRD